MFLRFYYFKKIGSVEGGQWLGELPGCEDAIKKVKVCEGEGGASPEENELPNT